MAKKYKWFLIGLAAVIVLLTVLGIWRSAANKLDLTDYILIETSGYNGAGNITVSINEDALCEKILGPVPDASTKKGYIALTHYNEERSRIISNIECYAERTLYFSNGDFFMVFIEIYDEEIFKEYGLTLDSDGRSKLFTIGKDTEPLLETLEIDIFDYLDVTFEGYNGEGKMTVACESKKISLQYENGDTAVLNFQYDEPVFSLPYLHIYPDDFSSVAYITFSTNNHGGLANGDYVSISIADDNYIEELREVGIWAITDSRTYTVSGLKERAE